MRALSNRGVLLSSLLWVAPMLGGAACGAGSDVGVMAPQEPIASAPVPVALTSPTVATTSSSAPARVAVSAMIVPEPQTPEHRDIPLNISSIPGAKAALLAVRTDANDLRDMLLAVLQPGDLDLSSSYRISYLVKASVTRPKLFVEWTAILKQALVAPSLIEAWKQAKIESTWIAPPEDGPPPRSARDIRNEQIAGMEKQIHSLDALLDDPNLDAAARKGFETTRETIRKLRGDVLAGSSADDTARLEKELFEQRHKQLPLLEREREEEMARRRAAWPDTPALAMKKKLTAFIALIDSVKWGAKLTVTSGPYTRRYFADPELEMKPPEWKMIFRGGKTLADEVRKMAVQCQNEL